MNASVVYQTRTGNTKKVADVIAATVGCIAQSVAGATIASPVDMLFLGAAIHGGDIDPLVKKFIKDLDPTMVKEVTLFTTGFEQHKNQAVDIMKALLEKRGIPVTDKCYPCRASSCCGTADGRARTTWPTHRRSQNDWCQSRTHKCPRPSIRGSRALRLFGFGPLVVHPVVVFLEHTRG
jgi:flavodoxin